MTADWEPLTAAGLAISDGPGYGVRKDVGNVKFSKARTVLLAEAEKSLVVVKSLQNELETSTPSTSATTSPTEGRKKGKMAPHAGKMLNTYMLGYLR